MPKAVIVTGGRFYKDTKTVYQSLQKHLPFDLLISGHAKGADKEAEDYADCMKIPKLELPALWNEHGKGAGPIRNTSMAQIGKALKRSGWEVVLVAFPGGDGTQDMIEQAMEHGIKRYKYGQS